MEKNSFEYYVERYIDGVITADEWTVLRQMIELPGNAHYLNELMSRQIEDSASLSDAFPMVTSRILTSVEDKIAHPSSAPVHRVHFFKTAWVRYAAAVLILFGSVAFFWINTRKNKELAKVTGNKHLQTDVEPGRNRAILTLANGQQIILDSTQGNIVTQGHLVVVNLEGKLKYEGIGAVVEYHTISTPKGGQYQIVLPDGSKVWLNAASSIKFPTAFTGNSRNVEVTGEAYMEIAKDPNQSFVVKAKGAQIQVLGTSFNLNAYQNESAVKTTLISGSVKVMSGLNSSAGNQSNRINSSVVSSDPPLNSVILKPGQQAVIADHNADYVRVQAADIEQALDWKNGILNFNGADLETVMRQLERWYAIEVRYQGAVPNIVFKGKMYRNVNFSDVLDMLKRMGVRYELEGKVLIVL